MSKVFQRFTVLAILTTSLGACAPVGVTPDAYWQRIDAESALYLTGPKAQQQLEENIATCVREVDELIRLKALRETTPPDTHERYRDALNKSGDLAGFETPEYHRNLKVDHSEYYDFESCMRAKGWERVKAVRYQHDAHARKTLQDTRDLRKYGVTGAVADARRKQIRQKQGEPYQNLNE